MPTGGGGGGLSVVTTNATLTGSGTAGSPLSVAGQPTTAFCFGANINNSGLSVANQIQGSGFVLPHAVTFGHIWVSIQTADAVNNYDLGIYNPAGTLQCHIGAQHLPSTGWQGFAVVGGSLTLTSGLYVFATTGNATTAQIATFNSQAVWVLNTNLGASAGGALTATVSAIAASPSVQIPTFTLIT